jgi:hypothetical protein
VTEKVKDAKPGTVFFPADLLKFGASDAIQPDLFAAGKKQDTPSTGHRNLCEADDGSAINRESGDGETIGFVFG